MRRPRHPGELGVGQTAVKLDGMLVNLENPDVGTRTTSLTRGDTGAGACEIIYVKYATIR